MNLHFTALMDFLRQAQRDISTRKIVQLGKLNRSQFTKAKKEFSLQFKEIQEILDVIKKKETLLILDYVLISQEMKIIDRPYNWVYNPSTRKVEPCLVILFAVFLKSTRGVYANHEVQLVVVADTKEKLKERNFYCLITNCLNLKYPQVMRCYSQRGKIEFFFKKLKSYLGITSFHSHQEETLRNHLHFSLAGYIIVQQLAQDKNLTFYQALQSLKIQSRDQMETELEPLWAYWQKSLVNIASQECLAA